MKVCFLASSASIHSVKWVSYFVENGYDVAWISLAPAEYDIPEKVDYYEFDVSKGLLSLAKAIYNVKNALAKIQPDLYHVHSVGTYGMVGALSHFRPMITTPWGSDVIYGKKHFYKKYFIAKALKNSKYITVDAHHMVDHLQEFNLPKQAVHIINFGIDTQRFTKIEVDEQFQKKINPDGKKLIISTRNFEEVYDVRTYIAAAKDVLEQDEDVLFLLLGRGSLEQKLKDQARTLGIADSVKFLGFFPNEDMPKLLNYCDLYVSTSLSDAGIAASSAEAMSCELPAVLSDSGENDVWIDDHNSGYLFKTGSSSHLAKIILEHLKLDAEYKQSIGIAGRSTIVERNDYHGEMAKVAKLYQQAAH